MATITNLLETDGPFCLSHEPGWGFAKAQTRAAYRYGFNAASQWAMDRINLRLAKRLDHITGLRLQRDTHKRLCLSANEAQKASIEKDKNKSYIQSILDLRRRITTEGMSFGIADAVLRQTKQKGLDKGVAPMLVQALTVAEPQSFMAIDAERRLFAEFKFKALREIRI